MSLFKGSTVMMLLFSLLGLCLHHGVDKFLIWHDVDYCHFFIFHFPSLIVCMEGDLVWMRKHTCLHEQCNIVFI